MRIERIVKKCCAVLNVSASRRTDMQTPQKSASQLYDWTPESRKCVLEKRRNFIKQIRLRNMVNKGSVAQRKITKINQINELKKVVADNSTRFVVKSGSSGMAINEGNKMIRSGILAYRKSIGFCHFALTCVNARNSHTA